MSNTTEFRNKLTGTSGNAVTSNTLSSTGGTFTEVSLLAPTYITNPDTTKGLEATVVQSVMGSTANYGRLAWTPSYGAAAANSASFMFRLVSARNTATMQIFSALALPAGGSTRNGVAVNLSTAGALQLALTNDAGATVYKSLPSVTLALDTWYRINTWWDCSGGAGSGTAGIAAYSATGSSVGSTTFTALDLGAATTTFTGLYLGKLDKSAQNTNFLLSDVAYSLGQASDFGASPSMAAPTPPTQSYFPAFSADAGDVVQIYSRTTPTTSGATENGITVSTVSAVDLVTGATVALTSANTPTWNAPATTSYAVGGQTISVETNRTREATMPFLQSGIIYTNRVTGTDSGGQSASFTQLVTLYGHDIWHKGTGGLVPGIITLPVIQAAFMRLTSGAAQFNSDASSVGTWSTDSTTGAAVYDPDTPGSSVTYAIDPTTGANVISS